ncbi:hypothetical protein [Deinococcus sp. Arct2-2]|nr:hypothetical protein [Deinococcus sp. Arct2-2]
MKPQPAPDQNSARLDHPGPHAHGAAYTPDMKFDLAAFFYWFGSRRA